MKRNRQIIISELADSLYVRYQRRMQLFRGWVVTMRGARAGPRFGVGSGVEIWHPGHLVAGHDVTIMDHSFVNCLSSGGVRIGDHTSFHVGFWLHCAQNPQQLGFFHMGSYSLIQAYGVVDAGGGGVTIGDHVLIGQMVSIHAGNHQFDDPRLIVEQGTTHKGITIEDDCWVGAKVTILDGVTVGRGSVIGAGAVVTRSVPPYSVALGNPARVIRRRGERSNVQFEGQLQNSQAGAFSESREVDL